MITPDNSAKTAPIEGSRMTWRLLESTVSLGFLTALAYYLGYSYYQGFFGLFGAGRSFQTFSTGDYLTQTFMQLAPFASFFLAWAIPPWHFGPARDRRQVALLVLVVVSPLLYLFGEARSEGFLDWWLAARLLMLAFIVFISSYYGQTPVNFVAFYGGGRWLVLLIWSLFVINLASSYMSGIGQADAKNYLASSDADRTEIVLDLKADRPDIEGRPLLLLMNQGGKYYVVEQAQADSSNPELLIIQESEVISARAFNSSGDYRNSNDGESKP